MAYTTEDGGVDFSVHNDRVDVDKLRAFVPKVTFGFARIGMSWGYKDPKFNYFRNILEDQMGVWFAGYHVIFPAENIEAQFDNMMAAAGPNLKAYVIDDELIHGCSPAKKRQALNEFAQRILDAGKEAWIYTSPLWCNQNITPKGCIIPEAMLRSKWWLAQYLYQQTGGIEYPNPPDLVNGISRDKVYVHQTTSAMPGWKIGQPSGSPTFDFNRWLIGKPEGGVTPPQPPPVLTYEQKVDVLVAGHPQLFPAA